VFFSLRFLSAHEKARIDFLLAGGLFVGSFFVYLQTLRPSFGWGDSSELTTAAYHLGIGHSPGYPTYMLIGYLFSHLPFASVAYGMNLMSAFLGSLAVALSFLVCRHISLSRLGAFLGAACFAFTATLWDLTTEAEVYTLHAAFLNAIILLLLKWKKSGKPHLAWAGFLYGLSLGNHPLTLLLLPGAIYFILATRGLRFLLSKAMLLAGVALLVGLSVYLYLPLRGPAHAPPLVNDPQNLKEVFVHLTAPGSRQVMFDAPPLRVLGRLWLYGGRLRKEVSWAGVLLGLLGVALLWRKDRKAFGLFALIFVCNVFYAANYSIFDIYCYFLPSYWVWCAFLAVGGEFSLSCGERLLERVQGRPQSLFPRHRRALLGAVCLLLPFWLLTGHWKRVDVSRDRGPEEFARAVMGLVEKDSLILADWWAIAPLGYLKYVEKMRPDVTLSPAFSLSTEKAFQRHLQREFLARFPAVYATEMLTYGLNELRKNYLLIPQGPVFRVLVNKPSPSLVISCLQGPPRFRFGDRLALIAWEIQPQRVQPPTMVSISLYWQSLQPQQTGEEYDVIVALERAPRTWAWREKTPLVHGLFPLSRWREGETLVERHLAFIAADSSPGKYRLTVSVRHRSGDNRFLAVARPRSGRHGGPKGLAISSPTGRSIGPAASLDSVEIRSRRKPGIPHKEERIISTRLF